MKKKVCLGILLLSTVTVLAVDHKNENKKNNIENEHSISNGNYIVLAPGDTIKVSSNTATGFVSVESDSKIDRIEVVRIDGSLIQDLNANKSAVKIDLRLEPKGIYMLRCHRSNTMETIKFSIG